MSKGRGHKNPKSRNEKTYSLKEGLRVIKGGLDKDMKREVADAPVVKETGLRKSKVTAVMTSLKNGDVNPPKEGSPSKAEEAPQMKRKRRRGDTQRFTPVDLINGLPTYKENQQKKMGMMRQILGMKKKAGDAQNNQPPVEKVRVKKHTPTKQLTAVGLVANTKSSSQSDASQVFILGDDDDTPTRVVSMDDILKGQKNEFVKVESELKIENINFDNLPDALARIKQLIDEEIHMKIVDSTEAIIGADIDDFLILLKRKFPQLFQIEGKNKGFVNDFVELSIRKYFEENGVKKKLVKKYLEQKFDKYVAKFCQEDWILDPVSKKVGASSRQTLPKHALNEELFNRISKHGAWVDMYEFFCCAEKDANDSPSHIKALIQEAIETDRHGKVKEAWILILKRNRAQDGLVSKEMYVPGPDLIKDILEQSGDEDPAENSHKVRNAIIGILGIASVTTGGYYGYSKMNYGGTDTTSKGDNPMQVAKNTAPAPMGNSKVGMPMVPSMKIDISPMHNVPMDAKNKPEPKMISGVMNVKNIDDPVIPHVSPNTKQSSKIVSGVIDVKPVQPKQPKVPETVDVAPSQQLGLVRIDEKSLTNMQDSEYKKMFEGFEFSLDEVKGRSITGLIEKHLMSQAKNGKERRAYRKNLQKLEKGWLIYMRQLELRVKKKIESGEIVNERDMADYNFWIMYKTDHRRNYEKAKRLTKKYTKLAKKGKKSHNLKNYQECVDMGTSLMEGLRMLNPKVASVNVVSGGRTIRIADGNGQVLAYLYDVSSKMGFTVPTLAQIVTQKLVLAKSPKEKVASVKKVEKSKVVSGVIETDFQFQRSADLNSFHVVSELETMFDAAPSVVPSMDVMGASSAEDFDSYYQDMFPWEREVAIAALKERGNGVVEKDVVKEIEMDMDYDMQDTVDDVAMYEDEMLLTPDNWADNTDININNNSFDVELPPVATTLPISIPPPFAPRVESNIEIDAEYDLDDNSKNVSLWSEEKVVDADWSVLDPIFSSERFYDDFENLDLPKETNITGYVENNDDIENPETGDMFQEGLNEYSLKELKNIKFADDENDFDCEYEVKNEDSVEAKMPEPKLASNEIVSEKKKSKKKKKKKKGFFGKIGSWFKKKKVA